MWIRLILTGGHGIQGRRLNLNDNTRFRLLLTGDSWNTTTSFKSEWLRTLSFDFNRRPLFPGVSFIFRRQCPLSRSKPEIYLWMTASIIGCLGLKSVNYERLHSFLWDFHNWMKLWSFIHLWRTSSISGGRQQICQQNINVCQIWETACHRVPNSCHKTLQLSIS